MSFFERNRREYDQRGIASARLPPGQYWTERFPVLHVGDVPTYGPGYRAWDLRIFGLVGREVRLDWASLLARPAVDVTVDIHCVTKWSIHDSTWRGVRIRDLLDEAGLDPSARFAMVHADIGYTTNVPLPDLLGDDCLVAYRYGGGDIPAEHGGPVRLLIPHLYFWKSAKWLRGIELLPDDEQGYWEALGYHDRGDPFEEERFQGD